MTNLFGEEQPTPTGRFKVPLRTEVAVYMKEKMHWPPDFCQLYADAFWDFYNSKGWKVGKEPMKSWHSAFTQWMIPDKKYAPILEECRKKAADILDFTKLTPLQALTVIDTAFENFKHGTYPENGMAKKLWEMLRAKGWNKLPKYRLERVLECSDNDKRKILALKELFENMQVHNYTFKQRFGHEAGLTNS